jgi:hypothetical protein
VYKTQKKKKKKKKSGHLDVNKKDVRLINIDPEYVEERGKRCAAVNEKRGALEYWHEQCRDNE